MKPDILVLGAGPAGFSIGHLMSNRGYSVEIIDPAFFPRAKICGEFLNPQAVSWLEREELLSSVLNMSPFPIYGMKISDSQGKSFVGRYGPDQQRNGYAIQRKDFDSLLVKQARRCGIVISEGYKAERLLFESGVVAGISGVTSQGSRFEKRARVIVGADGRNNLIGRTFGWMKGIRGLRKYAFVAYFDNIPGLDHFGEIHAVQDGYVGIAPLNASLGNVALVVDESALPRAETGMTSFFLSRIRQSSLRERFRGLEPVTAVSTVGPLAFEMKRASGFHTILVGDSCGFIDPFTGEGINYAFLAADLAADVLDEALRTGDLEDAALARYDLERNRLFRKKFQMARMLQHAMKWPAASAYLVRKFQGSLKLGDAMVSAVGSAIPIEKIWNLRFLLELVLS